MQRRNFIRLTGASLGTLLLSAHLEAGDNKRYTIMLPDAVVMLTNDGWLRLQSNDQIVWKYKDVEIAVKPAADIVSVFVQSPTLPLKSIKIDWKYPIRKTARLLGDHWERTYGDIKWQPVEASAKMPWYMVDHHENETNCFGVKTACRTICYWEVSADTLSLSLDTKTGGDGVLLKTRTLHAADIITTKNSGDENVFATFRRFCKMMCDAPKKVSQPVYGINDWYFAYGNNSAPLILEHTSLMAPLATDGSNRPFSVIDAGWAKGEVCALPNEKFGDMAKLADQIKKLGMRPGLWTRLLCADAHENPGLLMPSIINRSDPKNPFLDPTIEENLQRIKDYLRTYKNWGFELIKHDYTTFDMLGRWGFEMKEDITQPGWHFNDSSKTNAEIILDLYRAIRDAAGDTYLIGCNTISHLSAGIFELNRIGDDTSGNEWSRTRKMGVNALGFRMVQHKNFYEVDGDCVGLTNKIPWDKNKQWMQLLAQSSAPLFISAQAAAVGKEQKQFIKQCFAQAAKPQAVAEPLDWLVNQFPSQWNLDGKKVSFDWSD